jgi:membrane protein DedA with SNARE-associated domain
VSKVLGWILVALGFATCSVLASQNLDPQTGGNAMLLSGFLFVLPGVWLIRRSGRKAAQRAQSRDDMADAIATAIRKDREGR